MQVHREQNSAFHARANFDLRGVWRSLRRATDLYFKLKIMTRFRVARTPVTVAGEIVDRIFKIQRMRPVQHPAKHRI